MMRSFSLAALTVLELAPPALIDVAAACGYDHVGIRLLPAVPGGIAYRLMEDEAACERPSPDWMRPASPWPTSKWSRSGRKPGLPHSPHFSRPARGSAPGTFWSRLTILISIGSRIVLQDFVRLPPRLTFLIRIFTHQIASLPARLATGLTARFQHRRTRPGQSGRRCSLVARSRRRLSDMVSLARMERRAKSGTTNLLARPLRGATLVNRAAMRLGHSASILA